MPLRHEMKRLILTLSLTLVLAASARGVTQNDTIFIDAATGDTLRPAVQLPWPQNLSAALDALTGDEMFQRSLLGLMVWDLTTDSLVYEKNSHQLMRPASVQKLLTSVTALKDLGAAYQFQTRLYATARTDKDSILRGDIYIRGGFDPRFGADDMESFVGALSRGGLKCIDGRIFADVSLKDTLKWGKGWCWDDEEKTLTPLLYNGRDVFMKKFFEKLDAYGISHPGDYIYREVPLDSVWLLDERSHTVDQILVRTLKQSDNLYAESIFYQLGAQDGQPYPSARLSAARIEALQHELGLNPDDYNVADGSGLSLYNYATPHEIVTLLRYVWNHEEIYAHLVTALPIAGEDGTLKNRMKGGAAHGNVQAKTGTLNSVSTLAGYTTAPNGHRLCFCIMNQGIRSQSWAHGIQDAICEMMSGM